MVRLDSFAPWPNLARLRLPTERRWRETDDASSPRYGRARPVGTQQQPPACEVTGHHSTSVVAFCCRPAHPRAAVRPHLWSRIHQALSWLIGMLRTYVGIDRILFTPIPRSLPCLRDCDTDTQTSDFVLLMSSAL
jgi:hypothetical protein